MAGIAGGVEIAGAIVERVVSAQQKAAGILLVAPELPASLHASCFQEVV